jgi:hypothetical protein
MARPDTTRALVVAEISLLRKQQLESLEDSAFCGWTAESEADHEKRSDRMELLLHRLAELDQKP